MFFAQYARNDLLMHNNYFVFHEIVLNTVLFLDFKETFMSNVVFFPDVSLIFFCLKITNNQ